MNDKERIEYLENIIREALKAEETTHYVQTGRKPKWTESSRVWRILSSAKLSK